MRNVCRDEDGGVILENVITMWVFLLFTLGITQAGLIMWSAVGIQHGVQMAARCASVSDASIAAGVDFATATYAPCYNTGTQGAGNNVAKVRTFAASNSWGTGVPSSAFTPSNGASGACAAPYNKVTSSYLPRLMNFLFAPNLSPLSCYATKS